MGQIRLADLHEEVQEQLPGLRKFAASFTGQELIQGVILQHSFNTSDIVFNIYDPNGQPVECDVFVTDVNIRLQGATAEQSGQYRAVIIG